MTPRAFSRAFSIAEPGAVYWHSPVPDGRLGAA